MAFGEYKEVYNVGDLNLTLTFMSHFYYDKCNIITNNCQHMGLKECTNHYYKKGSTQNYNKLKKQVINQNVSQTQA